MKKNTFTIEKAKLNFYVLCRIDGVCQHIVAVLFELSEYNMLDWHKKFETSEPCRLKHRSQNNKRTEMVEITEVKSNMILQHLAR